MDLKISGLRHLHIILILCAHFGLFSFEVMSQWLTNSHLTVQWLMEKHVGDMNLKELLAYLDDIIVHDDCTLEEAEE